MDYLAQKRREAEDQRQEAQTQALVSIAKSLADIAEAIDVMNDHHTAILKVLNDVTNKGRHLQVNNLRY